jgi:hypothetical protein
VDLATSMKNHGFLTVSYGFGMSESSDSMKIIENHGKSLKNHDFSLMLPNPLFMSLLSWAPFSDHFATISDQTPPHHNPKEPNLASPERSWDDLGPPLGLL